MSVFSWLFHHPPPPSPYPIRGRDPEFVDTVTFYYRQELGRDPDPGGLASYVHAAQYGWTGEQIQQALHDSPEAVAYRARPKWITPADPLVGLLVQDGGLIRDGSGRIRVPHFYHDMSLIRQFADDPDKVRHALDVAAGYDWQGARVGCPLVETDEQDNGFWAGCHSSPELCLDTIPAVCTEFANRHMKLHLFGANNFGGDWSKEQRFITELCTTIRDAGHADTIGLFEWRNEFYVTSPYGGNSDETFAHGAEACRIARSILGCLTTMGSPGEDDDAITRSVQVSQIAGLDFGRDYPPDALMRHCDRAYYDGRYHGKYQKYGPRALWFLEPTGPDNPGLQFPDGVYYALNDPAYVYGLYMRLHLDGIAFSYLNGAGIRHHVPLESEASYTRLPTLLRFLPDDVCAWQGPSWFTNGPEFAIVVAESWGMLERPEDATRTPKRIETWTAQFADGSTQRGEGPIRLTPGYKAVAVKGSWRDA